MAFHKPHQSAEVCIDERAQILMPSVCSQHDSVPLEQEPIYGTLLASEDDAKKMFSITFEVNRLFMTSKTQTGLLLSVPNAFKPFSNDLRAYTNISE